MFWKRLQILFTENKGAIPKEIITDRINLSRMALNFKLYQIAKSVGMYFYISSNCGRCDANWRSRTTVLQAELHEKMEFVHTYTKEASRSIQPYFRAQKTWLDWITFLCSTQTSQQRGRFLQISAYRQQGRFLQISAYRQRSRFLQLKFIKK